VTAAQQRQEPDLKPQAIVSFFGFVLAISLFLATYADAANRKALVVGIDNYADLPVLAKAVNDALAMSATLERLGFDVHAGYDVTRRDFVSLLANFISGLQQGDEALVFYAGHAVEIERRNYLVPADATQVQQSNEALIISESISQDFILEQVTSRDVRLTVLIMDACRDNPFIGLRARSAGLARGLAIENPPQGTFLMFSADEGQQALDSLGEHDTHPNSIFTRTLLPLLEMPGMDIVEIAREARGQVEALASSVEHAQFPEYRDRMRGAGRFVLMPAAATAPSTAPGPTRCDRASAELARLPAGNAAALQAILTEYSDCPHIATQAKAKLDATGPLSLSVDPASVDVGDFLTIRAELPATCVPVFFNLAPSGQLTPIPNDFFRKATQTSGRDIWEITPETDFAVIVQEDDEPGPNRLGVFCAQTPGANTNTIEVLRALLPEFQLGRDTGTLDLTTAGRVTFATRVFTIR
jgi:hypothetical protein